MPIRRGVAATNRDASPRVLNNRQLTAANAKSGYGQCPVLNPEASGNQLICVPDIPSNAVVRSVRVFCPAITSMVGDIGLYRTTADSPTGGNTNAVVDADFFASLQAFTSALNGTEVAHESGVYTNAMREQPLWQALGLASDPNVLYDLSVTVTTASGGTGLVGLEITYV